MAFKNPNIITSVPKEEFDKLKEQVEKIELEIKELKSNNAVKTISNESKEKNEYTLLDINVKNAKLGGAPRIDYFKIEKQEKQEKIIEENQNDIIDQVNDLTNQIANENIETIPVDTPNLEKIDENDDFQSIIDISSIIDENKSYRVKENDFQISIAKTSSGHRTYLVNDEQLQKLKSSYTPDSKIIAA